MGLYPNASVKEACAGEEGRAEGGSEGDGGGDCGEGGRAV